jgi:hypothetical protein
MPPFLLPDGNGDDLALTDPLPQKSGFPPRARQQR